MKDNLAIYIHWPFCKSKCPYCDFNSHVVQNIDYKVWESAYLKEIDYFKEYLSTKKITSIFFGGGTPTLMPPFITESIINKILSISCFDKNIEITLEGNPTSVELQKFNEFKKAGMNRVSLGVQSLNDNNLKFLGREHSANEALAAVEKATIFDNYSFDLIYALPDQTLKEWEIELNKALKYANGHLSLYQLTIEKGTQFYSDYKKGKFKMPKNDLAADFYELTDKIMEEANILAYEVSNYAKKGFESRHNMTYWRYGQYSGIGAGAHSRINHQGNFKALMNIHSPDKWLDNVQKNGNGLQIDEILNENDIYLEKIMMGLRTKEGVAYNVFKNTKLIDGLILEELLEKDKNNIIATKKGILVLNSIINKITEDYY